jgi:hypothetical protein
VVIFFRAPGGRGIYKKSLELTQRPTPPTPALPNEAVGVYAWRASVASPIEVRKVILGLLFFSIIIVLIEGKMEPYRRTPQGNTLVPTLTHTPLNKRRLNHQ